MLVNFCFLQASPFSSLLMAARLQLHLQSTCTYVCVMYLCACCQPDFHMQLQLELHYFAIRSLTHTGHVVAHTTTPTLRYSAFPCGAGVQGSFRSFVWLFPMSSFLQLAVQASGLLRLLLLHLFVAVLLLLRLAFVYLQSRNSKFNLRLNVYVDIRVFRRKKAI